MPSDARETPRSHPVWLGGEYNAVAQLMPGAAAMMAVVITHPIDQTKIRSQTQRVRTTMLSVARRTVGDFGVRGLWTGLTGSLLRQATYGTTRFGVYGYLKEQSPANGSRSRLVMNGAIAGVFAGLVGAPAGESARYPYSRQSSSWCGCARMGSNRWIKESTTGTPSTDCSGSSETRGCRACSGEPRRRCYGA